MMTRARISHFKFVSCSMNQPRPNTTRQQTQGNLVYLYENAVLRRRICRRMPTYTGSRGELIDYGTRIQIPTVCRSHLYASSIGGVVTNCLQLDWSVRDYSTCKGHITFLEKLSFLTIPRQMFETCACGFPLSLRNSEPTRWFSQMTADEHLRRHHLADCPLSSL